MHDYTLSFLVRDRQETFLREAANERLAVQATHRPATEGRRRVSSPDAAVLPWALRWFHHARSRLVG